MEKEKKNVKHSETSTTVKIDAKVSQYRCSFFCTRVTDNDVLAPVTPKKDELKLTLAIPK